MADEQPAPDAQPEVSVSPGFGDWLRSANVTLAVSTYRRGQVITIGSDAPGRIRLSAVGMGRCMGMATDSQGLWVAATTDIRRFARTLTAAGGDAAEIPLIPQVTYGTGFLNAHDLTLDRDGRPVFANTVFNCVATTDADASFTPVWKPPFVSAIVAEDRCHLNGIAMEDGRVRYVTGLARSDTAEGWRATKSDGWLADAARADGAGLSGLHQPHSPRLHEGALWLLESAKGILGRVSGGRVETVCRHRGYPRGLTFHDGLALVGLSLERRDGDFDDTPLGERLSTEGAAPECGVDIVDPVRGERLHWLRFDTGVRELFDVAVLPGHANQHLIEPGSAAAMRHYAIGGLSIKAPDVSGG
jgi:uncharacterized protein (TIGR03032 family)